MMKCCLVILFALLFGPIVLRAQVPKFQWANSLSVASVGNTIASDAFGNLYATGFFTNSVDFDPSAATYVLSTSDSPDIFIHKVDADGKLLWVKQIGGSAKGDRGYALASDPSGSVCLLGVFQDTVDMDPGPGVYRLKAKRAGNNAFVLRLDKDGNFLWAKSLEGGVVPRDIKVDARNNVYVSGYFKDSADFNPGFSGSTFKGNASFLLKLRSDGSFVWLKRFGDTYKNGLISFATNERSDVFCTGYFDTTTNVDLDKGTAAVYKQGIYICRIDSNGDFVWLKQIDRKPSEGLYAYAVSVDSFSNIYTVGQFAQTVDFDPSAAVYPLTASSFSNAFIIKLDSSGNFRWVKALEGETRALSVVSDATERVYLQGQFSGKVDMDPGAASYELASVGYTDIFVSCFDSGGTFKWARAMGGEETDYPCSLILGPGKALFNSGNFWDQIYFDSSATLFAGSSHFGFFMQKMDYSGLSISRPEIVNFSLYPNPASDFVTLHPDGTLREVHFWVRDLFGKILMESKLQSDRIRIDIRSLPQGTYIFEAKDRDQFLGSTLLIKSGK